MDLIVGHTVFQEPRANIAHPTQHIPKRPVTIIGTRGCAKLGTVQASEPVRSFLRSERPSSLASAIMELGRANKTIYTCSTMSTTRPIVGVSSHNSTGAKAVIG